MAKFFCFVCLFVLPAYTGLFVTRLSIHKELQDRSHLFDETHLEMCVAVFRNLFDVHDMT